MSDSESCGSSDGSDDIFNDYVTLGKSTEFKEVVWLFPKTDQCPLKDCMLSCSSRSVCLGHFHLKHADKTMICTVCNELVSVKNPLNLFRHYQDYHPNEPPPKLKSKTEQTNGSSAKMENSQQPQIKPRHCDGEVDQNQKVKEQNEEDDVVILTGCGHISRWIWPKNLNKCQVRNCHANVKNRREAINHFRETHAQVSILCPLCVKPIYAPSPYTYKRHHDRIHVNMTMPYDFKIITSENQSKKSTHQTKKVYASSSRGIDSENGIGHYESKDDDLAKLRNLNTSGSKMPKTQVKREDYEDECNLVKLKYGVWLFPDTTFCPVISCGKRFSSRSEALNHYKQRHAMHSLYCHLCQKPIRVDVHKHEFITHFRTKHPYEKIPYGLGKSTDQKSHAEENDEPDHRDDSDEDVSKEADDLIVLGGCGLKFTWRFPKSTQCPVKNCKIQFGKRSDAIDHYKVNHAKKTTLCPACNSPILMRSFGDIAFHYRKRHPNKDLPLCFKSPYERKKMDNKHAKIKANSENGSQAMKVEKSDHHDESDNDEWDDDMIVLSGYGLKFTWQFPKSTRCPVKNCRKQFGVRSDAIVHYKRRHAEKSTLCPACNTPKLVRRFSDMSHHYKNVHPNLPLPSYFKKLSEKKKIVDEHANVKSQMKRSRSESRSESESQPSKEKHKKSRLSCPLKFCNYETMQMTELCTHWTRSHGELEFPEYRGKNRFTHIVDPSQSTIQRKINVVLGQSKPANGSGAMNSSSSQKPKNAISISSESDSDSKIENTSLHQKTTNGSNLENRKEVGISSEWFTLTSDDDGNDEADQVQDDRKCKKLTLSLPKLSHTESNKKSERNSSSNSSSSSQDDSGSDYGGYTPNRHKMRGKRVKYFSDNESCSD